MLARIRGGNSGIAEYLITGKKIGREKSRDELDNRVILTGDLDLTDAIINSIDDKGQERYLHITLSFRENDVTNDILDAVTNDYKKLLMSAFKEDEYNFYAEAHLPKVKNIIDYKTGELIERKPHIHIVIPKTNLLTGKYLNPVGLVERNAIYLDAIQEQINIKYNLESPKVFMRETSNNYEHVIARITGELLSEKNGKFKHELANEVLKNNITSYDGFKVFLESKGEVVIRNKDKSNEYLAVKPDGQKRFINLKSKVFSKNFIETGISNQLPKNMIEDRVSTWVDKVSKEEKYIANASSKVKSEYRQLTYDLQKSYLDKREKQYEYRNRKVTSKSNLTELKRGNIRSFTKGLPRVQKCNVASGKDRRERPEERPVIQLLYGDEGNSLGVIQSEKLHAMRWSGVSSDSLNGWRRVKKSVLQQIISDSVDQELATNDLTDFKEIRKNLNANYLLNELKNSHCLTGDFKVTRVKDGSYRIKDGTRNYNVSDFLTKKMSLTWIESKEILKKCYEEQLKNNSQDISTNISYKHDKKLWIEFKKNRLPDIKESNKNAWINLRENYKSSLKNIHNNYSLNHKNIVKNKKLSKAEKIAQKSINTYNRLMAIKSLKDEYFKQRNDLKESQKDIAFYFNQYQREVVDMGVMDIFKNSGDDLVIRNGNLLISEQLEHAKKQKKIIEELLNKNRFKPQDTNRKGHVTYVLNDGSKAFVDQGDKIIINKKDQTLEKLACALEMAVAKFGKTLTLEGKEEFKEAFIRTSVLMGVDINFKPEQYNQLKKEIEKEIEIEASQLEEDKIKRKQLDAREFDEKLKNNPEFKDSYDQFILENPFTPEEVEKSYQHFINIAIDSLSEKDKALSIISRNIDLDTSINFVLSNNSLRDELVNDGYELNIIKDKLAFLEKTNPEKAVHPLANQIKEVLNLRIENNIAKLDIHERLANKRCTNAELKTISKSIEDNSKKISSLTSTINKELGINKNELIINGTSHFFAENVSHEEIFNYISHEQFSSMDETLVYDIRGNEQFKKNALNSLVEIAVINRYTETQFIDEKLNQIFTELYEKDKVKFEEQQKQEQEDRKYEDTLEL